jgi:hypothetical protein
VGKAAFARKLEEVKKRELIEAEPRPVDEPNGRITLRLFSHPPPTGNLWFRLFNSF